VEGIWIIGEGPGEWESGTVYWDTGRGVLRIKCGKNEVSIDRTDIQVIDAKLWEAGFIVSAKGDYYLGRTKLASRSIYLSGVADKDLEKLQTFFDMCKRFSRQPAKATRKRTYVQFSAIKTRKY